MKVLRRVLATALLAVAFIQPALAAEDDLAARIAACTREKDDALRLACFDRAAVPQEPAPKRISAIVTAIETRTRGELVVTLDNGQVWAQKESGAYFPLKVGEPVTILAGTLGSFRLISGNRATAVTRVH
jgi:hypothetical protein